MVSAEEMATIERLIAQVHARRDTDGTWEASVRLVSGQCVTTRDKHTLYDCLTACVERLLDGQDDYADGPALT